MWKEVHKTVVASAPEVTDVGRRAKLRINCKGECELVIEVQCPDWVDVTKEISIEKVTAICDGIYARIKHGAFTVGIIGYSGINCSNREYRARLSRNAEHSFVVEKRVQQ